MRFLFATRPFLGHLYPMVPLGLELAGRGHDVVVASSPELETEVVGAGLLFAPAGLHPHAPLPPAHQGRGEADFGTYVLRRKFDDLHAVDNVDVVVREPTDLAAAVAASAAVVPHVVHGRSHYIDRANWRRILQGKLDIVRAGVGLAPDPALDTLYGDLYLDSVPPWFQQPILDLPTQFAVAQAGNYEGYTTATPQLPEYPYVYITLGTVYNRDRQFFRVALGALRELGLRAVVTVGSTAAARDLENLAGPDCLIAPYLPQSVVLAGACLVVCHGGYSTVLGALHAGVPVLCVPRGSDQCYNAAKCVELGVGKMLYPEKWTLRTAVDAMTGLLHDEDAPHRAREYAERDVGLPTIPDAATLLEELPDLLVHGTELPHRLEEIASGENEPRYRSINRRGWQSLSRHGSPSSVPLGRLSPVAARQWLDRDGWLPWKHITDVLCLAGGGGQQGPLFAQLGCNVLVVDLSREQLDQDRRIAAERGLSLEIVEADMCDLTGLGDRVFDLVYQPVSTCYVPDVRVVYDQVARHVRPGGWYWSEHYSPLHLQLDATQPWDGIAYRIGRPQRSGSAAPWSTTIDGETVGLVHYIHGVGDLLGNLCAAGFAVQRVAERRHEGNGAQRPGEPAHLAAFLPPFLTVLARRYEAVH
jgi:UDP:flavonoid glycosyltransferase YjiC (YdhE family)/SAM-dependent methyltransferase